MMPRAWPPALVAAGAAVLASATAQGQTASLWIDANAAHSRPPASTALDAASYGLLGARLRVDGTGSGLELSAATGRGSDADAGSWLSGRGVYGVSRVLGMFDVALGVTGSAVTFLTPIRFDGGDYSQSLYSGGVRPSAGFSLAGTRIGAEAAYTRGAWRSEVSRMVVPVNRPGPLPLPQPTAPRTETETTEGDVVVTGGALSLLRVIGPATVELRGASYDAQNQVADGRYSGIDASVTVSLGTLDVSLGARRWQSPGDTSELGGHAGVGLSLGESAYLQAVVSRSVSDPVSGISGDVGVSAGISVRVGKRMLDGPPPAAVGTVQGRGRVVRFALKRDARSVDVAGDFSGWERRPLTRGDNGEWTLETVLEPGVYHYSFVIDGETWMVPPDATGLVDDGFGRKNATLVVAALENGR